MSSRLTGFWFVGSVSQLFSDFWPMLLQGIPEVVQLFDGRPIYSRVPFIGLTRCRALLAASISQTSSISRSVPARLSALRFGMGVSIPCTKAFGVSLPLSIGKASNPCSGLRSPVPGLAYLSSQGRRPAKNYMKTSSCWAPFDFSDASLLVANPLIQNQPDRLTPAMGDCPNGLLVAQT
jgi:hypothetical protein